MTAALSLLEESLDEALRDAGIIPPPGAVQGLAQGVADWLDVIRDEESVDRDVAAARFTDGAALGPYWSPRTLRGLALMLRRRR